MVVEHCNYRRMGPKTQTVDALQTRDIPSLVTFYFCL